jgi:hypothetical protein
MSANPFNSMFTEAGEKKHLAEDQSVKTERRLVEFTMKRLGLKSYIREVEQIWNTLHGYPELRFTSFNARFPSFPFLLASHTLCNMPIIRNHKVVRTTAVNYHVHRDANSFEPARFKDFNGVPFFAAFKEFYGSIAELSRGTEIRKICLVFPRFGFRHGMAIHNDGDEQWWQEGLRWVYKVPITQERIYVQGFATLIDAIYANGRGWKPAE